MSVTALRTREERMTVDRIPPHNLEAEMALLGAVLVDSSLMPRVCAVVRPPDFYAPLHETVFIATCALYERGEPIDKVSLAEELRRRGMLDRIGGLAYLSSIMEAVPTAASADYYAKIVSEKAQLRGLIRLGGEITELGYGGEADADGALTETLARTQAFVDSTTPMSRLPMRLDAAAVALETSFESGTGIFHPTPFPDLTENIGGWKKGGLYILGGSPKMGKTYLANTVGLHLAGQGVGTVAHFPLEIGRIETQLRFEQFFGRVDALKRVRRIPLTDYEQWRIRDAREQLAHYPIALFGNHPPLTTDEIIVACRRLATDGPIAGVIVDHIGFLRDVTIPTGRSTKHERIELALHRFLDLGRQLECPVFLVWHVNREAKDGEPSIFDLRDGGNVEGAAQTILFVHRPHWNQSDGRQREGKLIIAATRMGRAGTLGAYFDDERGVWCEPDGYSFIDKRPEQSAFDYDGELDHTPFDEGGH